MARDTENQAAISEQCLSRSVRLQSASFHFFKICEYVGLKFEEHIYS